MKKFLTFKFFEWAVVAASMLLLSTAYAMSADIPHFDTYVNDYAHVLTDNYRHQLNERLHNFELSSPGHAQVVVAIVPNTGDESIEEFANKAFHNNKLGHAGNNNGVLTVISMDHKMRIEVGYDLEPLLTDSKTHDILDSMKPALKAGNFQAAFDTEMSKLLPIVSAGSAENAAANPTPSQAHQTKGFPLMTLLLLIAGAVVLYLLYRRSKKSQGSNTDTGASQNTYDYNPVKTPMSPDYSRSQPRPTYNPPRSTYTPPRPSTYRTGPFVSDPEPYVPPTPLQPTSNTGSTWKSAAMGGVAGFAASELLNSRRRDDDTPSYSPSSDSYSSGSSSSSSSDSSSSWSGSSDSGFSGDSGSSGGGGGSDSW